jgi:glycosyltransferase involved in cell wall biosynthesis
LIDDAPLRRRLGAAARDRAARYTPALMADRYLELYERLAAPAEAAA